MRVVNIRGKKDIELWSWKEKILNISKGAFQPHSVLLNTFCNKNASALCTIT